jgi:GNAT superfamily N-acetyltransferase
VTNLAIKETELETHLLRVALEQLEQLDRQSIDEEMFLTSEERSVLKRSDGFAVLCYDESVLVGGAYALPAEQVAELMEDIDPEFSPQPNQLYIYSVVVHPDHRRRGLGSRMREYILQEAKNQGYTTGATHVTLARNWAETARAQYRPTLVRRIDDYWFGLPEPRVDFLQFDI